MGKCGGIGNHAPAVAPQQLGEDVALEILSDPQSYSFDTVRSAGQQAAALITSQAAEIERLREAVNKERRRATDAEYFCVAYRNMLGPIGLKVAQMWEEKGVKRIHFSWAPAAAEMTGEERAQLILDWEYAPSREVSFVDNDAALTTGAAHE